MKCPHCLESFHEDWIFRNIGANDADASNWGLSYGLCPACNRIIVFLINNNKYKQECVWMVYPKGISRSPLPKEVTEPYVSDYKEACLTLQDSPKASAALSRRCLQSILRGVAKIKKGDLNSEIDEVITSKQLPSALAERIDAIRVIGNFAAHPIKSQSTGEIVDVEPGEAEWNLDVLEGLSDVYFVQPAKLKGKKATLNQKLKDAGKPPLK